MESQKAAVDELRATNYALERQAARSREEHQLERQEVAILRQRVAQLKVEAKRSSFEASSKGRLIELWKQDDGTLAEMQQVMGETAAVIVEHLASLTGVVLEQDRRATWRIP
mmetsp:Transcript_35859/g.87838  ORF Transcript_35859/g.87838 Transcript_35859/m.87838 type:complete len:112 (-) Transcript_35859:87-422(-)